MFPVARFFLLVGAFAGLLVGAVSGNMTGDPHSQAMDAHSTSVGDCCYDLHSGASACDEPCSEDQQECPDHPGEHHHHHSCSGSAPHIFAYAIAKLRVPVPEQKRTPIASDSQHIPDSPVFSEDKPPLI